MIDLREVPSKRLAIETLGLEGFVRAVLALPEDLASGPSATPAQACDDPPSAPSAPRRLEPHPPAASRPRAQEVGKAP